MTKFRAKVLPMLIVTVVTLAGTACTKDKMMGDGNMMSDTGSTMHKMDDKANMSKEKGMMKN